MNNRIAPLNRVAFLRWLERCLQAELSPIGAALLWGSIVPLSLGVMTLRLAVEAYLGISLTLLLPIMLVAWYLGLAWGIAMTGFVVLSWLAADLIGVTPSVPQWVIYVNAVVRAGVFALVALLVAALRQAYRQQQLLATVDVLTGLGNRVKFMAAAETERQRAMRFAHPLTIAFLDLDQFKRLNDGLGHEYGDRVLRAVGAFLQQRLRNIDYAARLGGDEFVILLPETDAHAGLHAISDMHRGLVAALQRDGFSVGVSAGAATFLDPPRSVDQMLEIADQLMYKAKREGKGTLRHAVVGQGAEDVSQDPRAPITSEPRQDAPARS